MPIVVIFPRRPAGELIVLPCKETQLIWKSVPTGKSQNKFLTAGLKPKLQKSKPATTFLVADLDRKLKLSKRSFSIAELIRFRLKLSFSATEEVM